MGNAGMLCYERHKQRNNSTIKRTNHSTITRLKHTNLLTEYLLLPFFAIFQG